MAEQYGVITEQNDLCMNFMPIDDKDKAVVEKVTLKNNNGGVSSAQVINEEKK